MNTRRLSLLRFFRSSAPLALGLALVAAPGCGDDESSDGGGVDSELAQAAVDGYASHVESSYAAALDGVTALRVAVEAFVASPSDTTLEAAKSAWKAARPAYIKTEAFRFYDGPIDAEDGPEGRINGWPLDEQYIDYVADVNGDILESGIIQMPEQFPVLDEATIADANEVGGEKNLSAGFHAIEFLLWGQDQDVAGPGNRPATDYIPVEDGGTAPNPARRAEYLVSVTRLLESDIASVAAQWVSGQGYAASFTGDDPEASLVKIFTGVSFLATVELSSERMNNAYELRDQEEEHSCFSDTTHIDNLADIQGISEVYRGGDGSLSALVASVDADIDATIRADLDAAEAAINAIPVPFDQAILDDTNGGREAIVAAVVAVETVGADLEAAAAALGLELPTE